MTTFDLKGIQAMIDSLNFGGSPEDALNAYLKASDSTIVTKSELMNVKGSLYAIDHRLDQAMAAYNDSARWEHEYSLEDRERTFKEWIDEGFQYALYEVNELIKRGG